MFWKTGQSVLIAACVSKRRVFGKLLSAHFAITFISQRTTGLVDFSFFLLSTATCQVYEFVMLLYADQLKRIGFGLLFGMHHKQELPNLHALH